MSLSLLNLLRRIWYGPPVIRDASELKTGTAIVEGTCITGGKLLTSPLTGSGCLAFHYRATYLTPSRTQGVIERVLKDVEVYSSDFEIDIGGKRVKVIARTKGEFDKNEHQKLQSGGFRGFKATENLIRPGNKVRITGKLRKGSNNEFMIYSRKIELLPFEQQNHISKRRKKAKNGRRS